MSESNKKYAKGSRTAARAVDTLLAFVLVLIEATALVDEAPHEWFGIAAFALTVTHIILGRKRIVALVKGKKTPGGIAQLALDVLLMAAIAGQVASCIVISKYAFGWLPVIPGALWARSVHLACGYWAFALAFIHAGTHIRRIPKVVRKRPAAAWLIRLAITVFAVLGLYFFITMNIPAYMFLTVRFAFVDLSVPLIARFGQWACIGALFAASSFVVAKICSVVGRGKKRAGTLKSIDTSDGFANRTDTQARRNRMETPAKTLVAYFSATGTTERLARKIADMAGADIFEISPASPYTAADLDWHDPKSRSSVEMNDKAFRPAVKELPANVEDYDTVLLGFPIWWYVAPTIVNTFLEGCDLAGKTVVPFATSGGSGMGNTNAELAPSCPGANLLPGKRFASASKKEIDSWLSSLEI